MAEALTADQFAELRRLHEAATAGPWAWETTGDKDNSWGVGLIIDDNDEPVVARNELGEGLLVEPICDGLDHPENAELIAVMRNALPALLDRAAELEDRICDAEMDAEGEHRLNMRLVTTAGALLDALWREWPTIEATGIVGPAYRALAGIVPTGPPTPADAGDAR